MLLELSISKQKYFPIFTWFLYLVETEAKSSQGINVSVINELVYQGQPSFVIRFICILFVYHLFPFVFTFLFFFHSRDVFFGMSKPLGQRCLSIHYSLFVFNKLLAKILLPRLHRCFNSFLGVVQELFCSQFQNTKIYFRT